MQVVARAGNNKSRIARDAGISRNTLYRILRGDLEEVKIATISKLTRVLKVRPQVLMSMYFQRDAGNTVVGL
ncbi:helix-turn-helix domain-containing protein [Thiothrix sp. UBA5583]